jgi:hypothetical protein
MTAEVFFAARRSTKGLRLFVAAALALAVFGAVVLFSGDALGAWLLGFGAVTAAILLLQALRPGWRYAVGPEGIGIRRTFGARTIRRSDIVSVEAVDGTRIEEILAEPPTADVGADRGMSIAAGLRARRELSRVLDFASAPVVLTQTTAGGPLRLRRVGAKAPGRFVLVTLAGGARRALSPVDVDGFITAYHEPARL